MAILKKKTTIVSNMTYMAVMSAINLIFIILATYLPISILLLIIILPLVSSIVAYYCLKRLYIVYALASIGLCLIFNISDTIFYIVPAVITGFFIGLMLEYKTNPFWMILVSSVIQAFLTYLFIPLINLIGNTDFVFSVLVIFKLQDFAYREEITHLFIYLISLAQSILSIFVLLSEIGKIGIKIQTRVSSFMPYIAGLLICLILSFSFALFNSSYCFVFTAISFYFAFFLLFDLLMSQKKSFYILIAVTLILSFFSFVFTYKHIAEPYGFLLFGLFSFSTAVVSFVKNYLLCLHQ